MPNHTHQNGTQMVKRVDGGVIGLYVKNTVIKKSLCLYMYLCVMQRMRIYRYVLQDNGRTLPEEILNAIDK